MTNDALRALPLGTRVRVSHHWLGESSFSDELGELTAVRESKIYPGEAVAELRLDSGYQDAYYAKDVEVVKVTHTNQLSAILFGGVA